MIPVNQSIPTPPELIKAIEKYYGIVFIHDLAASKENAVCEDFFTEEQNALDLEWPRCSSGFACWLNPPFNNIEPFIKKCYTQSQHGSKIVSIIPIATSLNTRPLWLHSETTLIHKRIWPNVRDCMISFWPGVGGVCHAEWDKKTSTLRPLI